MNKFCINCGRELSIDAIFCSKCGKQQVEASNNEQNSDRIKTESNTFERQTLLQKLQKDHIYFQQQQSIYDDYDLWNFQKVNFRGPNSVAIFIVSFILAVIIYFIIAINFYEIDGWLLFFCCIAVFGILLPFRINIAKKRKAQSNYRLINQKLSSNENLLRAHYNAYADSQVSFEYSNPKIIDVLIQNISSGRADNLKESISCMLDDIHKQQMLIKQDEIARNSKDTANSALTASLFSAGIFLNSRK